MCNQECNQGRECDCKPHIGNAIKEAELELESRKSNEQLRAEVARLKEELASLRQQQSEPKCKDHPDAPHGFDRNASHSENRYVCTCEYWTPPAQSEKNTTSLMRPATPDDVVAGNTFHYADGDDGPFSVVIEEVHRPHDMWKAFTATDGCRYGLDGAMVEAVFTNKAQSESDDLTIAYMSGFHDGKKAAMQEGKK